MYVVSIGFDVPNGRMLAPTRPYLSFVVAGATDYGAAVWPGVVNPRLRWATRPARRGRVSGAAARAALAGVRWTDVEDSDPLLPQRRFRSGGRSIRAAARGRGE